MRFKFFFKLAHPDARPLPSPSHILSYTTMWFPHSEALVKAHQWKEEFEELKLRSVGPMHLTRGLMHKKVDGMDVSSRAQDDESTTKLVARMRVSYTLHIFTKSEGKVVERPSDDGRMRFSSDTSTTLQYVVECNLTVSDSAWEKFFTSDAESVGSHFNEECEKTHFLIPGKGERR